MAKKPIVTVPDPVLKQKASPVARVDEKVRSQMQDMLDTMRAASGIGLAANQIGMLNRIIICDIPEGSWGYEEILEDGVVRIRAYRSENEVRKPLLMANPEIIALSEQKSVYEEGCLSIPQQYADVVRPAKVRVRYLDEAGKAQEWEAEGLASHCVQHEIDHLNGVLFIDYLTSLKRNMMIRKVKKLQKTTDAL